MPAAACSIARAANRTACDSPVMSVDTALPAMVPAMVPTSATPRRRGSSAGRAGRRSRLAAAPAKPNATAAAASTAAVTATLAPAPSPNPMTRLRPRVMATDFAGYTYNKYRSRSAGGCGPATVFFYGGRRITGKGLDFMVEKLGVTDEKRPQGQARLARSARNTHFDNYCGRESVPTLGR